MTPQMILQEFIREFRYVPHEQLLDYNPYWPCIQNYLGVVTKYNWPASLQPFKYTIPYFYLDAE